MNAYKGMLHTYLHWAHDALRWELQDLDEYDLRRPLVATGTDLLGLVKHTAATNVGYFGSVFDRPFDEPPNWMHSEGAEDNVDVFATEHESIDDILGFDDRCWRHVDATVAALDLDSPGRVLWWPGERGHVTLHTIMVHCAAEMNRHCGHADIVRELIDGWPIRPFSVWPEAPRAEQLLPCRWPASGRSSCSGSRLAADSPPIDSCCSAWVWRSPPRPR